MAPKIAHFLYIPLTGLGLYNGHRGNRWLKSRIKIFKETVLYSLLAQTDQDFIIWVSVRHEDRQCPIIQAFKDFLISAGFKVVFTYSGVCFWDDKYPDEVAYTRLVDSIHGSMGELINAMGDAQTVLMTIQPSDDCYNREMVTETKEAFWANPKLQVYGYKQGYVMNYLTGRLKEWNPQTTPPFYTIKFTREVFTDPLKHVRYIGPYKSHEYVKDFLKAEYVDKRGFIVGTHLDNISTVFDHPYAGKETSGTALDYLLTDFFGANQFTPIEFPFSIRRTIFNALPYGVKRKLRFLAGEKKWLFRSLFSIIYNFMRG